jgi:hypothetical protein
MIVHDHQSDVGGGGRVRISQQVAHEKVVTRGGIEATGGSIGRSAVSRALSGFVDHIMFSRHERFHFVAGNFSE